jgi:hypothetical protein
MQTAPPGEPERNPEVIGAAPFVAAQVLCARRRMTGAIVRGIDPAREPEVTDLVVSLQPRAGTAGAGPVRHRAGGRTGASARRARRRSVTLIAPSGQVTPAGVVPRIRQMTVVGTFDSGHFEYDSALALLHQDDAARIFRWKAPGIRLAQGPQQGARWRPNWAARSPASSDLDAPEPDLVRRGAGQHDVHHHADRHGGRTNR